MIIFTISKTVALEVVHGGTCEKVLEWEIKTTSYDEKDKFGVTSKSAVFECLGSNFCARIFNRLLISKQCHSLSLTGSSDDKEPVYQVSASYHPDLQS